MASIDSLIKDASKQAASYGGVIALLLVIKSGNASTVQWDATNARFIINGEEVPIERIRAALSRVEDKLAATILKYNQNLYDGTWDLKTWRTEMEKLTTNHHILFAALALGGIAAAVRDATVKRRYKRDAEFIKGYSRSLKNVPQREHLSPRSQKNVPTLVYAVRRGRSYIRSINVTYQLLNHKAHIIAGYTKARRVLTPAEHCRSRKGVQGCLEAAAWGWVDIRKIPPIGTLVCRQFCKCYIIYRR